jgi:hypothetical protein
MTGWVSSYKLCPFFCTSLHEHVLIIVKLNSFFFFFRVLNYAKEQRLTKQWHYLLFEMTTVSFQLNGARFVIFTFHYQEDSSSVRLFAELHERTKPVLTPDLQKDQQNELVLLRN